MSWYIYSGYVTKGFFIYKTRPIAWEISLVVEENGKVGSEQSLESGLDSKLKRWIQARISWGCKKFRAANSGTVSDSKRDMFPQRYWPLNMICAKRIPSFPSRRISVIRNKMGFADPYFSLHETHGSLHGWELKFQHMMREQSAQTRLFSIIPLDCAIQRISRTKEWDG